MLTCGHLCNLRTIGKLNIDRAFSLIITLLSWSGLEVGKVGASERGELGAEAGVTGGVGDGINAVLALLAAKSALGFGAN
jgi:hypothetical protein